LKEAEKLGSWLLTSKVRGVPWVAAEEIRIRLTLIRIYNAQGRHDAAITEIQVIEGMDKSVFLHVHTSIAFFVERAVTLAGLGEELRSKQDFVTALVRSATILGIWHSETLEVLYKYGKALRERGNHKAAALILRECCLGSYHHLGRKHPLSRERYSELER
jgi:hypothetical protein